MSQPMIEATPTHGVLFCEFLAKRKVTKYANKITKYTSKITKYANKITKYANKIPEQQVF